MILAYKTYGFSLTLISPAVLAGGTAGMRYLSSKDHVIISNDPNFTPRLVIDYLLWPFSPEPINNKRYINSLIFGP